MRGLETAIALVSLTMAAACGSSVDAENGTDSSSAGTPDPCAWAGPRVSNAGALERIACTGLVPSSASVQGCTSSPSGSLDDQGMDDDWTLQFADETSGQAFSARVAGTAVEVETKSVDDHCHGTSLNLVYSAVVVPDAADRLIAVDTIVDGYTNWFIEETLDCGGPSAMDVHVVEVQRLSEDKKSSEVWFFYYGPDDTFEGQCGPCASPDQSACGC